MRPVNSTDEHNMHRSFPLAHLIQRPTAYVPALWSDIRPKLAEARHLRSMRGVKPVERLRLVHLANYVVKQIDAEAKLW